MRADSLSSSGERKLGNRLTRRLIRHHLPLSVFSLVSIGILYVTRPYADWVSRASFATAYPALLLLSVTLLLGPLKMLRGKPSPISTDLRRDIGIWAGIDSILHSIIGQNVHLRGRPWLYYIYSSQEHHSFPIRHDLFGFSNYTGLLGFLAIVVLIATSNDYCLRRLGAVRWKQWQRLNYAVFALVAVHAASYVAIEKQKLPYVTFIAVCVAIAVVVQLMGVAQRRRTGAALNRLQG